MNDRDPRADVDLACYLHREDGLTFAQIGRIMVMSSGAVVEAIERHMERIGQAPLPPVKPKRMTKGEFCDMAEDVMRAMVEPLKDENCHLDPEERAKLAKGFSETARLYSTVRGFDAPKRTESKSLTVQVTADASTVDRAKKELEEWQSSRRQKALTSTSSSSSAPGTSPTSSTPTA